MGGGKVENVEPFIIVDSGQKLDAGTVRSGWTILVMWQKKIRR